MTDTIFNTVVILNVTQDERVDMSLIEQSNTYKEYLNKAKKELMPHRIVEAFEFTVVKRWLRNEQRFRSIEDSERTTY